MKQDMKQELTLDDARLAARVASTLELASRQPDAAWDDRVAQVIAQAAMTPPRRSHKWQWSGGLALAASVAFMVALPSGWVNTADEQVSAKAETKIDGQMLEQIDWLMAMEEASRDRR